MISLVLAFCIQQISLKDVHIVAMPLDKAVTQLSKLYNSPMDVSNLLKDKIIIIDATQVAESEVRDQIAKTINASWERKEGLWHLTKSAKQQREDLDKAAAIRSRFLKKTLEIRKKSLDEKPNVTSASATQLFHQLRNEEKKAQEDRNQMGPPGPSPNGYGLPNHRLMSRFLLKFGAERIAAIPNGHRAVFALHPNPMQLPIGTDISEILAKYQREQNTWENAVFPLLKDQEGIDQNQGIRVQHFQSSQQMGFGLDSSFGRISPDLKDLLFTVYCSQDGSYQFQLIGISQGEDRNAMIQIKGTTLEGAFAGMSAGDFEINPVEGFKLSQESEDFKNFRENNFLKVPETRRSPLLAKLADPVSRDPLSFGLTEAFIFDAKRLKRNIVALVSDSQLNIFEPLYGDMLFQEKFKSILQDFISVDEKWIRMFAPPYSEPNLPRSELKRLIANVRANKKVGIFDRAAIASYRPRTNAYSYVEGLLDRFAESESGGYNDSDALKLIGLLSESEQLAASRPNGIPYRLLNSKAQQHLFECCFFNENNRVWFVTPKKRPEYSYMVNEPTALAPKGIANNAALRIHVNVSTEIKEASDKGSSNISNDANGWGQVMYQVDHPEDDPGNIFTFDRARKLYLVTKTTYEFKLQVNDDCQWQSTLSSSEKQGSNTFTINSLPDYLKAEFEAGYKAAENAAKIRKERLKNKGGGGES